MYKTCMRKTTELLLMKLKNDINSYYMFMNRKTQYCPESIIPNLTSRFDAIPVQILALFCEY